MRLLSFSQLARFGLVTLIGLAGVALVARDGRDFAGFYSLHKVEDNGADVRATLVFQLYNYSGSDLTQAAVIVRETPPGSRTIARFPAIAAWTDGTDIIIHQQVTIPRAEFQQWSERGQPNVFILYKDYHGRALQKTAQMSPHPIANPDAEATVQ